MAYVNTTDIVLERYVTYEGVHIKIVEKNCEKCGLFLEKITAPIYEPFMGIDK